MTFHVKPHGPERIAAAVVVCHGPALQIDPRFRQLVEGSVRETVRVRLAPIKAIDFYPPRHGFGSVR